MSGGRAAAIGLAAVLAGIVGLVGWVLWSAGPGAGEQLVKYDDDKGESNRYVNLDDGEAQLSVGSPDGHEIVVQWRDADGRWGAPQTVWTDAKNIAIDNTVRYGGGTVAIEQIYTTDIHSDSDIDSFTVAIVCRDGACVSERLPGFGGDPQVASDGQSAYLAQSRRGAHLWTPADGIYLARWSGHPGFEYGVVSPSVPVLAPDGSLRVVSAEPSRRTCDFELFTSTPGTADLTRAGTTTEPLRGRRESDCGTYLDTYSNDWVTVHPMDPGARTFWFVRDDEEWTTTFDDPSGLEIIDVDRGCCDSSVIGFVHWNSVAFGSPDGRRIQVQTHRLGDETWSEPLLLDGAPAGRRCTWMDGTEVGDEGFAVLMTCDRGRSYAVAATPDLERWDSTYVSGVKKEPVADGDRLTVGGTTWTPEDGFQGS